MIGVMAEALDTDLVGVVVAATCVGILIIIIIALTAYCCYKRSGTDRKSVLGRKDSGSVSTNATQRWTPTMVPSSMHVYNVPTEPLTVPYVYSQPPPTNYYLGYYAPKFIDAERIDYMRQYASQRREMEEEHARRVHEREHELHVPQTETSHLVQMENSAQPNGHVIHDFSASSVNYRVIRKQHKHEKMPEWLRKSYGENERSIDLGEEGSKASSVRSTRLLVNPQTPTHVVRAKVSPKNSTLDSRDVLHVARDFTIVDYVNPVQKQPRPSSEYRTARFNIEDYRITTTVANTTTTSPRTANTTHTSVSTHVPPASTSTPRAPPGAEEESEEHHRMRRPGEGFVPYLPNVAAREDVRF